MLLIVFILYLFMSLISC